MVNKKLWFGMLIMVLTFGLAVIGCDNGSTNDDGSYRIIDIGAYHYGPDRFGTAHCQITLESNGKVDNFINFNGNGFSVKINDVLTDFNSISTGGDNAGWDFMINFDEGMFIVGKSYKIQVIYTSDPENEVTYRNLSGKEFVLESFDTGTKSIRAAQW